MKKKDIKVLTYAGIVDVSISDNEDLNSTFPPQFWVKGIEKDANKLFYAMLKTDDKMVKEADSKIVDSHEGVAPHVIDMLIALNELKFPIYGQRDVSTREGNARKIANDVLPYAIAAGNDLDGDRKKALDIGRHIIEYYVQQHEFILSGNSHDSHMLCNISTNLFNLICKWDTHSDIEELFEAVRENAKRIISDVNYINMIGTYKDDGNGNVYGEDTINGVFPKVSLIYTCSLMGDENITKKLFDMNLDELKKYTRGVRHRFLDSSIGNDKMEYQIPGKHFKH